MKINSALDKLKLAKPVYYSTVSNFNYKTGLKMAKTDTEIIRLDLEHGPFDMGGVKSFIDGLIAGGPTKFGYRTPCLIAELPIDGSSNTAMVSNSWMIKQILAQGVHGLILCHASSKQAVKTFIKNSFYSFENLKGVGKGLRGNGAQKRCAYVWGISEQEYLEKASIWPQNENGELMLGVKIENPMAAKNCGDILKIKGLSFAEWGPGDMTMSLGYKDSYYPPYPKKVVKLMVKIRKEILKNKLFFLNLAMEHDVKKIIDTGAMIIKPNTKKVIKLGRRYK